MMSKRKRTGVHALVYEMAQKKQALEEILLEGVNTNAHAVLAPAQYVRDNPNSQAPSFIWSPDGVKTVHGTDAIQADEDLLKRWVASLQISENLVVTTDIAQVVRVAAEQLPQELVVMPHDLYFDHGYLHFETPLVDDFGESVRALTWHDGAGQHPTTGQRVRGLEINFWRDTNLLEQEIKNALVPPLNPYGGDFLPYGELASVGWQDVPDNIRDLIDTNALSIMSRFVVALQSFLRDGLPAVTQFPIPKSLARHVSSPSGALKDVSVITLRQRNRVPSGLEEYTSTNESGRHLTHRHIVRGHWHGYWVNPGHELHSGSTDQPELRHKYLMPYIKGPENAPFAYKEKAYAVSR